MGLVVAAVILFTPQCAVEHQALLFDTEQYLESPQLDVCHAIAERISAYNGECNGDMVLLDCG